MFKKITRFILDPKIRFNYLTILGLYNDWDDEKFLRKKYKLYTGKELNLYAPETFNEKIQWLKLYDRNPGYTELVDKYSVKKYVADKIGSEYIIPTLGVWDCFDEIDFELLPDAFVLKTTHDSGGVFICKDKSALNKKKAKKFLNKWLRRNYYMSGREYPYKNVSRKIIVEEYMTDESGEELKDYKVFNFNGIPKMIQVDYDRFRCHKRNLYTTEWDYIPASIEFPTDPDHRIEKPQCLDQMLKLASVLSQGFAHLRTDFYVIENKIYFGELTFYHGSGFETFTPEKFGFETGSWLALPGSEADLRMKERI